MDRISSNGGDPLGVFVSYSRRDSMLADALVAALEAEGFEVMIDRRDLPFGEEWQGELQDFIRNSDTVVWLVSLASVGSRWVNWELGELQRAGKRLVPVVVEDIDRAELPDTLGKIHLLPASGTFAMDDHLKVLVDTLHTDRAWLKEATRLGIMARTWTAQARGTDRLLRGMALVAAEHWRAGRPGTSPAPAAEILDFIAASQVQSKRRQRNWISGLSVAAVILLGLTVFAFVQRGVAVENQALAKTNEKTANERAARLSAPAAASLRQAGLNTEALVVLLDAASFFDDATAPSSLRYELERALDRAAFERARMRFASDATVGLADGQIQVRDANGATMGVDNSLMPARYVPDQTEDYDCTKITENVQFEDEEFYRAQAGFQPHECFKKESYVLFVESIVGANFSRSLHHLFREVAPGDLILLKTAKRDNGIEQFDWSAEDGAFTHVYVDFRTLVINRFDIGEMKYDTVTKRLDLRAIPTQIKLFSPEDLLVVADEGVSATNRLLGEQLIMRFFVATKSLFVKPLSANHDFDEDPLAVYREQGQLLPEFTCEVGVCRLESGDNAWLLVETDGQFNLFEAAHPKSPVGTFRLNNPENEIAFLGNGPELIVTEKFSDSVQVFTPPPTPGLDWSRREVYKSALPLVRVESDQAGDRLLLVGVSPTKHVVFSAYSLSTRSQWRDMGRIYKWGDARSLSDGRVVIFHSGTGWGHEHSFPSLSALVDLARQYLPRECQPATEEDSLIWRTSPCWAGTPN